MKLNLSLGVLAVLQIAASLFAQITVLRLVGAGSETDAFVAAQALPLVLFAILSVSLQSVWQPRLAILSNDRSAWRESLGIAQGQVLITFGFIAALLWLSVKSWTPILFPGFDGKSVELAASMALPLFAAAALNCHSAVFTTALRANNKFIRAEVIALLGTLLSIGLLILLVPLNGVQAAARITLVRATFVCGILYWQTGCPQIPIRKAWAKRDAWKQLRPLIAGSSLYKTAPLFDRYWSSQASAGSVTIFSLTQTAMGALATVLERAICMPVAPQLARLVERKDFSGLRYAYRRCILHVSGMTLAIGVIIIALNPIWSWLLEPLLKLSVPLAQEMWLVCLLFLGYLHVAASGTIAVAAFYAMGDTRTPVKVGVIGFLAGVLFKGAGFVLYGLPGLAIATSAYYACNMVAMCVLLEKKINASLP